MKKKVTGKLISIGRKNKFLRVPLMVILFVFLMGYNICRAFAGNRRRLATLACLCLFFVASSSFTFEGTDRSDIYYHTVTEESGDTQTGATRDSVNPTEVQETELIEDSDVMDGYVNSEFEVVQDDEKIDADEILNNTSTISENTTGEEQNIPTATDWRLVLINKQHPIPEGYSFTLGTIRGNMKCDERIIPEIMEMLQAAKKDGINLVICSPYRDLNRQEVLFNRKIQAYMKKGMSYMDAYRVASQSVTVPGASEHQIGLALDIICDSYSSLNAGFGGTEAGEWLAEHSCEYGFILRYPEGKEKITGIEYEPWHFRYVGKDAAMQITKEGITLEEFLDRL